jgi:hypothetical protein
VISSPTLTALAPAFVAAQAAFHDAAKSRTGQVGQQKYPYATLEDCLDAVRAPLAAQGLAIVQAVEGAIMVTTILHRSGEWVESHHPVTIDNNPQRQGSATTYARRQGLMAALGITSTDDDDDAGRASSTKADKERRQASHHASWPAARTAFCAGLPAGVTYDHLAGWCEAKGRPRPSMMTPDQRAKLAAYIGTEEGRVVVLEWSP